MTPNELQDAAIEIFGRRGWVTDLAACLRVDRATVYRYVHGQLPIPGPVEAAVQCWLGVHRKGGGRPDPI